MGAAGGAHAMSAQPLSGSRAVPWSARIAAAAIVAMVLLAQGISAPFVKDAEPQSAEYIQSVVDGHWILPADYYGESVRKPMLFYWAAAAITAATGGSVDEVRARVLSVICGTVVAIEVLEWTASAIGVEAGALAFVFLLGSFAFTSRGTLALTDMMLLALMFGAWCLMFAAIEVDTDRRRTVAIGALLGLAVLTKGPVAIVIPALAALIYLVLARKPLLGLLRARWPWIAIAIAIAMSLAWYVPALTQGGREMARIIFEENAGHFLPRGTGGTGEAARPIYYIAMKMMGGITPLNLMIPALVLAFWPGGFETRARKAILFQASWLLAVLIFFSAASAKRDDYILPGIPPLAILFASLFTSLDSQSGRVAELAVWLRRVAAVLVAVAMLAGMGVLVGWNVAGGGIASIPFRLKPADRAQVAMFIGYFGSLRPGVLIFAAAVIAGALLVMSGIRNNPAREGFGLGLLSIAGVILVTGAIRPALSEARTLKVTAPGIARIADGHSVYSMEGDNHELSFYLGRPLPALLIHGRMRPVIAPAYLFAYARDFERISPDLKRRLKLLTSWDRIGRDGAAQLFEIEPEADLKPGAGSYK